MALKAMKCPNCDANIQVDDNRDYGFCTYCGAQIQVKEVVEVRSSEEFDANRFRKLMEDSQAYLNMGNYFRAEEGFMEMIRLYPGRAVGYERLICTITHDYKLFPMENEERLQQLKKKMMLVAEEDEKAHYGEICKRVERGFSATMVERNAESVEIETVMLRRKFSESILATFTFIFCCLLLANSEKTSLSSAMCVCAVCTGIMAIVCKVKLNNMQEEEKDE